jgi:hypothetical protein
MRYEKHVYAVDGRWQYTIFQDGVPSVVQDFDPELPGFEPMSEARANELADAVIQRLLNADAQA